MHIYEDGELMDMLRCTEYPLRDENFIQKKKNVLIQLTNLFLVFFLMIIRTFKFHHNKFCKTMTQIRKWKIIQKNKVRFYFPLLNYFPSTPNPT